MTTTPKPFPRQITVKTPEGHYSSINVFISPQEDGTYRFTKHVTKHVSPSGERLADYIDELTRVLAVLPEGEIDITKYDEYGEERPGIDVTGFVPLTEEEIELTLATVKEFQIEEEKKRRIYAKRQLEQMRAEFPDLF